MSNLQIVQSPPCDDLLDYIYGELPAAKAKSFEEHLATCASCKAEVEATQRLRNLTKEALPPVEPSNDRLAAISAQVLHAAAQRKAGTMLPMFRKMMRHPGFAAMAAMVVVGLFITTQWTSLKMPAKAKMEAPATSTAAPAAAAPVATPAPTTPPPAPVLAAPAGGEGAAAPSPEPDATARKELEKATADKAVSPKEDAKQRESSKTLYETRKDAPTDDELWSRRAAAVGEKKKAKDDGLLDTLAGSGSKNGVTGSYGATAPSGLSGGIGATGPGTSAAAPAPKPATKSKGAAPQVGGYGFDGEVAAADTMDRKKAEASQARAGATTTAAEEQKPIAAKPTRNAEPNVAQQPQKAPAEAPAPPAAPAASAPAPAPTPQAVSDQRSVNSASTQQGNFSNLGKSSRDQSNSADAMRRRGESLARAGKCEDALRAYNDANRLSPNVDQNAADQLSYARCLREQGRLDAAQMALDSLQQKNVQSNSLAVQNEQTVLNNQRRQYGAPAANKAGKAAPKARSAPATEKAVDAAF